MSVEKIYVQLMTVNKKRRCYVKKSVSSIVILCNEAEHYLYQHKRGLDSLRCPELDHFIAQSTLRSCT
jgi:hypothetical protein